MLLRLFKSLAVSILLIGFLCVYSARAAELGLEISYFSEVVFKDSPLSFHINRVPESSVQILSNTKVIAELPASTDTFAEYTFYPQSAVLLSFSQDVISKNWQFKVVEPTAKIDFEERDGYLYAKGLPVILMPDHLLPPALDRRWQTVQIVEHAIQSQKTRIETGLGFFSENASAARELPELLPRMKLQSVTPAPEAWFRVHGFLLRPLANPVDFVVFDMSLDDLERGMPPQMWLMKWYFLLQYQQQHLKYTDGLLMGPIFADSNQKWQPVLEPQLKSLALAHGLRYIDRALPPEVWQERLRFQLGKKYDLL